MTYNFVALAVISFLRDAIQTMTGHSNSVHSLCLDTANKHLFSGSADTTIIMWSLESYEKVRTFEGHTDRVNSIVVLSNGNFLSGANDKTVRKWNISSGKCVRISCLD